MKRGRDGEIISNKEIKLDKEKWFRAARNGDTITIETLIKTFPQLDVKIQDDAEYTALMWVSAYCNLSVVKPLIENGADVHVQNKDGDTASSIAVYLGRLNVAKALKSWRSFLPEFTIYYKRFWK